MVSIQSRTVTGVFVTCWLVAVLGHSTGYGHTHAHPHHHHVELAAAEHLQRPRVIEIIEVPAKPDRRHGGSHTNTPTNTQTNTQSNTQTSSQVSSRLDSEASSEHTVVSGQAAYRRLLENVIGTSTKAGSTVAAEVMDPNPTQIPVPLRIPCSPATSPEAVPGRTSTLPGHADEYSPEVDPETSPEPESDSSPDLSPEFIPDPSPDPSSGALPLPRRRRSPSPSPDLSPSADPSSSPDPSPSADLSPSADPSGASEDTCSGCKGSFCITLDVSAVRSRYKFAFFNAAKRWCSVITETIGSLVVQQETACPGADFTTVRAGETIKDVKIFAQTTPIDGVENVLGSAGPCFVRESNGLPWLGAMAFDSADMEALLTSGQLESVIIHEMGHVLGFGTIDQWSADVPACQNFDSGVPLTELPLYTGDAANAEYRSIFQVSAGSDAPVEFQGGAGTACAHWSENTFQNELMTGRLDDGTNPLSRISVGALKDLGYKVDLKGADDYQPPGTGSNNRASIVAEEDKKGFHCNVGLIKPGK